MKKISRFHLALFALFLLSGFCGLLYQVVWLRLAFASFGVITPVISVVLSVFMLGLAVGSWAGGRWIEPLCRRAGLPAIWFYGLAEVVIGLGGILVPRIYAVGERLLLSAGAMESFGYLACSAAILAFSILPWCLFMGTTFPFMMAYIRQVEGRGETSFSFLYLANVIGAMCGTVLTAAFFIELLGLRHTLLLATAANFTIAAISFLLGANVKGSRLENGDAPHVAGPTERPARPRLLASILFMTGLVSMAMEVVWTRAFTPVLWTTIYSFAALLAVYLSATWVGSLWYRRHLAMNRQFSTTQLIGWLAVASFLPVLLNDPRLDLPFWIRIATVLASIIPFCALLGYLTPKLVDEYSGGRPGAAGAAYAINVIGCILGPLIAGYLLLPFIGVKLALTLLAAPFILYYLYMLPGSGLAARGTVTVALAVILLAVSFFARSYEDGRFYNQGAQVRRDHVATVISSGEAFHRRLLVNGIGMTYLTPVTKVMAHLPLVIREDPPESALVICLGMGTTFRSLAAWPIDASAVELVPSVRDAFGYYHADAADIVARTNCHVIVDDGRRYLKRSDRKFDLITIDPPPPVEAAGSSLLYTVEFYEVIKAHLTGDGFLAQWFPGGEKLTLNAVANSLRRAFPYIHVFHSVEDVGYHFICSMTPFDVPSVEAFNVRLPDAARADLIEWSNGLDAPEYIHEILRREVPLSAVLNEGVESTITDDRPYSEYFFTRRVINKLTGQHKSQY